MTRQTTTLRRRMTTLTAALLTMALLTAATGAYADQYDNADTLVVAQDGTGQFTTITEAVGVCRAFMDYHKVILVHSGVYREKLVIPQWLTNIEILGEDSANTVIVYSDHANIKTDSTHTLGTFRSYTVRVEGNDITFRNITISNDAPRLGQAVALHTEGDRLVFVRCRILGNQDTVYTGTAGTRLYFKDCYIEGTTDFIFGPSTAWFEGCTVHSKANSYVTAASTPKSIPYGYVFNHCTLTAAPDVTKVYLGRPWRDYGYTLFMNCTLGPHIRPEGWHPWQKEREATARYAEYNNSGEGARTDNRASWTRQLAADEAATITVGKVFSVNNAWTPE